MNLPVLPEDVNQILKTLNQNGFEAFIVGGCVRDCILGRIPQDWDITTSANPMEVKKCFSHTFDTGIQHGTVTVVLNKVNYEVTTYRIEGNYTDFRHPESVHFTKNLTEDLLRRDFTMNAIAYHPKFGFSDPFGGMKDIENKIIRGVGQPALRFQEDALRMLRAVRFSAQLGFQIEEETKNALKENCILIQKISVERIREELQKLLLAPFSQKLPDLWESGLLTHIHPKLATLLPPHQEELIYQLQKIQPNPILCWTLFFQYLTPEETETTAKELKFDTKTMRTCVLLSRYLTKPLSPSAPFLRELISRIGIEEGTLLLKLRSVLPGGDSIPEIQTQFDAIIKRGDPIFLKDLAITGSDLQKLGMKKGKCIGEMLHFLLKTVHHDPSQNKKELLLDFAKKNPLND